MRVAFDQVEVTGVLGPCTYNLCSLPSPHTSFQLRPMCNRCAAINGIHQAVVTRANELASLSARGENLIAACATLTAEETQALEEAVGALS